MIINKFIKKKYYRDNRISICEILQPYLNDFIEKNKF